MWWDETDKTPDVWEQMAETPCADKLEDAAEMLDDTDHNSRENLES